jgi:hypothetical protein
MGARTHPFVLIAMTNLMTRGTYRSLCRSGYRLSYDPPLLAETFVAARIPPEAAIAFDGRARLSETRIDATVPG